MPPIVELFQLHTIVVDHVVGLESRYPVLDRLEGTVVNVDELDYLAKRQCRPS